MDEQNWKVVQTKTFTKWVNNKLKKADYPPIENLFTDLSSGVALAHLLHALGKPLPMYNSNPFSRIQKVENLAIIIDFIREQNVSLVNIGPADIVDGDQKLILGLIWTLISRMSISDILSSEFFTMKEEILGWSQRVTEGYKTVRIEDLTTSWQDGLGFNAIIHKFRPNLVPDFFSLDPSNGIANCEQAFRIAEESLEIARLFDPEDIVDVVKPDEKSILTYLSQFYQKFQEEERKLVLKERLQNVIRALDWSINASNSYEKKARAFIKRRGILEQRIEYATILAKTFQEELKAVETMTTEMMAEVVDVHLLLNDIQEMHQAMNLKAYHPPGDVAVEKITMSYLQPSAILDMEAVKSTISEFEGSEAAELTRIKNVSTEIYSILDKETQIAMMDQNAGLFGSVYFSSKTKQKAADKLKEYFEAKKDRLSGFVRQKNSTDALIGEARKMFSIKDVRKTGLIGISDLKKILRALRLDSSLINEQAAVLDGSVSVEKMSDIICKISMARMGLGQIKDAFDEFGLAGRVNLNVLVPDCKLNGLGELVGDAREVSFEDISLHFND